MIGSPVLDLLSWVTCPWAPVLGTCTGNYIIVWHVAEAFYLLTYCTESSQYQFTHLSRALSRFIRLSIDARGLGGAKEGFSWLRVVARRSDWIHHK